MTPRENLLSLYRRQGFEKAPIQFDLCPSLHAVYYQKYGKEIEYPERFGFPSRYSWGPILPESEPVDWKKYFDREFAEGTMFDMWGVAREPGSSAAAHMTRMHHPMKSFDSIEQMQAYPYPDYENATWDHIPDQVERVHEDGFAVCAYLETTIWETAWYMRSMENLVMDMATGSEMAEYHLDRITDLACIHAAIYARTGADILALGDDVGMQSRTLMSKEMYRTWLKPRLKRVIDTARSIKPDIIVHYHSCGYVHPLIEDLIEAGIDVLNPVQPECMDFSGIHQEFGDRLSFSGTIGTQTTMPFGAPEEVRETVFRNLEIAGEKGGLLCSPTHVLEPEVPWENVEAYVQACRDFK